MKSVLMSIQPKWCELIASGKKTIEVRKTAPKEVPFKVYIYSTKNGESLMQGAYLPMHAVGRGYNNIRLSCYDKKYKTHRDCVNGKIIGEFICDKVICLTYETKIPTVKQNEDGTLGIVGYTTTEPFYNGKLSTIKGSCLEQKQLLSYGKGNDIYGLHITALKIYDKPKELSDFYSIKQCKPEYSPFGYQWTWEDRHKRNTGGWGNKYRPVPIECHRCRCLVGGEDYLDEKSGCVLFDYECISKYHKPIERPPQSWQYIKEEM